MPFDFHRPSSLAQAIEMLRAGTDDARVIAGGQSLMPMINLGLAAPTAVVDVSGLPELQNIEVAGEEIVIGAGTRHRDLIASPELGQHLPLLVAAARNIGSPRIRNVGTLGGSLSHCDPAAELPLACVCLDAEYQLQGPNGSRWSRAEDFSQGYYTPDLQEAEILARVRIPGQRGTGWGFQEYARRAGDFALAAAAAVVSARDGVLTSVRIAVSGASDRPIRLTELETLLLDGPTDRLKTAAQFAADQVDPSPDPYVDADYRRRLIGALTGRALEQAVARCEEERA